MAPRSLNLDFMLNRQCTHRQRIANNESDCVNRSQERLGSLTIRNLVVHLAIALIDPPEPSMSAMATYRNLPDQNHRRRCLCQSRVEILMRFSIHRSPQLTIRYVAPNFPQYKEIARILQKPRYDVGQFLGPDRLV